MRVRVVCGLSDTMASLEPMMRLSSVDLPALGRPTSATNPDFMRPPGRRRSRRALPVQHVGGLVAHDAHLVNPAPFDFEHLDAEAVHVHLFADGGNPAEMRQQEATNGFKALALDLYAEALRHLVDVHLPGEHE